MYKVIDADNIRLVGTLAKVDSNGATVSVVKGETAKVELKDPEVTTFGQNLYDDILIAEGANYSRRYSLVFCAEESTEDPAAEFVRASVVNSFTAERPRRVDSIRQESCVSSGSKEEEIVAHFRLVPRMGIIVELKYRGQLVASGLLLIVVTEEFLKDTNGCEMKVRELIRTIRESYGTWSPPIP